MGVTCWLFYIFLGFLFFFILTFLENKYSITKIEKLVFSIIMLMISSGFCYKFSMKYTENIFLVFVFLLIVDVIYSSYFVEKDFFDRNEKNISYYVFLIFIGFVINQEFINQVNQVFLTGKDFRIILWFLSFIFLYSFFKDKKILSQVSNNKKQISPEYILIQYAKLKYRYYDECYSDIQNISNILYAIMIFQNSRRGKMLRNYDYLLFRLNGNKRCLGIMQIESSKFLTDCESIEVARKKVEKIYARKAKGKKNVSPQEVISSYDKENYLEILNIFDVIQKF